MFDYPRPPMGGINMPMGMLPGAGGNLGGTPAPPARNVAHSGYRNDVKDLVSRSTKVLQKIYQTNGMYYG